jgi:photosystem II stability/assembly factor-like uncharacterized protein
VTALSADPRRGGAVYAALTQGGIYKTSNGGQTWTRSTAAGPQTTLYHYAVAVDPALPTTIFAAGESETGNGPQILRSTNGGHTWAKAP